MQTYNTLVAAIPPDTKKELKESLKKRLEFGNDHSLRNRLKGLLRHHGDATEQMLKAFGASLELWAETVISIRNEITHQSGAVENVQLFLWHRTQEVHLFCHYLLLYESLGDADQAMSIIAKSDEFRRIEQFKGDRGFSSTPRRSKRRRRKVDASFCEQERVLPKGLGCALMEAFGLTQKQGLIVGEMRKMLSNMCTRREIESLRESGYYVEIVRRHGLFEQAQGALSR